MVERCKQLIRKESSFLTSQGIFFFLPANSLSQEEENDWMKWVENEQEELFFYNMEVCDSVSSQWKMLYVRQVSAMLSPSGCKLIEKYPG